MAESKDLEFDKVPNSDGAKYVEIKGHQAFVAGIHPNDVDQGLLGNCYFLSSIASIAHRRPSFIKGIITTKEDESYDVKLFKRGWFGSLEPMTINVRASVPQKDDKIVFTKEGDIIKSRFGRQVEVWPIILEKAYADMLGGYNNVIGGWPHHSLESLTGQKSEAFKARAADLPRLEKMAADGYAMACYTRSDVKWAITSKLVIDFPDRSRHPRFFKNKADDAESKPGDYLAAGHAYYITAVDASAGIVKIRNPWGWESGESSLTGEEFEAMIRGVSVNPIVAR